MGFSMSAARSACSVVCIDNQNKGAANKISVEFKKDAPNKKQHAAASQRSLDRGIELRFHRQRNSAFHQSRIAESRGLLSECVLNHVRAS
jgi:hypothetical protein